MEVSTRALEYLTFYGPRTTRNMFRDAMDGLTVSRAYGAPQEVLNTLASAIPAGLGLQWGFRDLSRTIDRAQQAPTGPMTFGDIRLAANFLNRNTPDGRWTAGNTAQTAMALRYQTQETQDAVHRLIKDHGKGDAIGPQELRNATLAALARKGVCFQASGLMT